MKIPNIPTRSVVVGLMFLALMGVLWTLMSPVWFGVCAVILGIEAATLADSKAGNTISEEVWRLNKRPIVPFGFGAVSALLAVFVIPQTVEGAIVALFYGVLMGHFFFSRQNGV